MRHARGQKLQNFRRKWPFCGFETPVKTFLITLFRVMLPFNHLPNFVVKFPDIYVALANFLVL
jgi:hypothetical protein